MSSFNNYVKLTSHKNLENLCDQKKTSRKKSFSLKEGIVCRGTL